MIHPVPSRGTGTALALGALLLLLPARAVSQQPTVSESLRTQMAQTSAMMGPMMGQMMEAMMEGMLRVMAKPESVDRLATFAKNYYDALIRKGFTKEQALQIVIATGMPRMPNASR